MPVDRAATPPNVPNRRRHRQAMIVGTGIDTVSIERFERLIALRGERFLARVFAPAEIAEGVRRGRAAASYFAARFAAREAFVKAFGTGFVPGVTLRDIEVRTNGRGKPELAFSTRIEEMLRSLGVTRCHLSIAHDGDSAQAIVILEGA